MSPKSIPPAISAMPPKINTRRGLMRAKVNIELVGATVDAIARGILLVCGPGVGSFIAKCRHDVLGKQMLRLDAFPMLQPAKIGDDGQFSDAALCRKLPHLADHLLGRSDKTNFLFHH